jgi:hypothetical protein
MRTPKLGALVAPCLITAAFPLAIPTSASALQAASNLKVAAVTSSSASLEWTASGDATGYRVWRGDANWQNWILVEPSRSTTSYGDSGLVASATHTYVVRAYDASGDVPSNGVLTRTPAANAPAPSRGSSSDAALFAASSVWNTPIPPSPVLDAKSSTWVSSLSSGQHPADLYEFGVPIYETPAGTPRYTVPSLNAPAWGPDAFAGITIPLMPDYAPASGLDGAMAVIDRSAAKAYGFWRYNWNGGRPYSSWGGVASLDGPGNGDGSTGAGVSRAAGVVRAEEIAAGVITHPLVFSTDIGNCSGTFRYPASKTDGRSSASTCMPEGTRVQLDPSVDLDAIPGITEGERIVGRALQKYGAIDIDNGSARMAFIFEEPTDERDPYPSAGLVGDYFNMSHIPWNRLRVLRQADGG